MKKLYTNTFSILIGKYFKIFFLLLLTIYFPQRLLAQSDSSMNTITNFQITNGGTKFSFDVYSLTTSGIWIMGNSSYFLKFPGGTLSNPYLTYVNPKFTIGSPSGSYDSLRIFGFSNRVGIQIHYIGGPGAVVSEIPGSNGLGEKIASVQMDILQNFAYFQWDQSNSSMITNYGGSIASSFLGNFVPLHLGLNYPNGGENFPSGSNQNIIFSSLGVNFIKIEYTTDSGNSWSLINSNVSTFSGNYSWTVPNLVSTQCKIKISDVSNPNIFDISDNTFTISPVTLNTGLMAYYPFNGNTNDESGNGNHGTNFGATLTTDNNGIQNSAYDFNGSSSYISIPDFNILNINNLTFTCIVNPRNLNTSVIVYHGYSGELQMNTYNGNQLGIGVKLADNNWYYCNVNAVQNNWSQLTGVWERGNSLKLYLNGQFQTQTPVPNFDLYEEHYHNSSIGVYSRFNFPPQAFPFNGKIDEVRFYNRVLSETEILQLYSQTQVPIPQPSISISSIQINPGGSVNITGQNFRVNTQVKVSVTSSNSENVLDQTIPTNSNGGFSTSFSSNANSSPGIYTVSCRDTVTNQSAPNKIFEVKEPPETFDLEITSPKEDTIDQTINLEWVDKMLTGSGYFFDEMSPAKRKYKYKINYTLDGTNWSNDEIIEGSAFINSVPVINKQISLPTSLNIQDNATIKFRVTDEYRQTRQDVSQSIALRPNTIAKSKVSFIWDYESNKQNNLPLVKGICADGISRFYINVSKLPGNYSITSVTVQLNDNLSINDKRFLGKLKIATQDNSAYSNEAWDASALQVTNINNDNNWIWFVAPDDFVRNGSLDGTKDERIVKANITINYSSGPPESGSFNINVIRPPVMLLHGFGSNPKVWEELDIKLTTRFKFKRSPRLDPSQSYHTNALILLNGLQSSSNYFNSFQSLIYEARASGYACNQISFVGHSMGGCILRTATEEDIFKTQINYDSGYVDRFITVDTPHEGSPLADFFVKLVPDLNNYSLFDPNGNILKQTIRNYIKFSNVDIVKSGLLNLNNKIYATSSLTQLQSKNQGKYVFEQTKVPSFLIAGDFFPGNTQSLDNINWGYIEGVEIDKYKYFLESIFPLTVLPKYINKFYRPQNYLEAILLVLNRSITPSERIFKLTSLIFDKTMNTDKFLSNSDLVVSVNSQLTDRVPAYGENVFHRYNGNNSNLGVGHAFINPCTKDDLILNKIISLLNLSVANPDFKFIPASSPPSQAISDNFLSSSDFAIESNNQLIINSPQNGVTCFVDSIINVSFSISDTSNLKYVNVSFQGEQYYDTTKSLTYNFNLIVNSNELDSSNIFVNALYLNGDSINYSNDYKTVYVRPTARVLDIRVDNHLYNMILNESVTPNYKTVFTKYIYQGKWNDINAIVSNPAIISFDNSTKSFKAIYKGETSAIVTLNGASDTIYFAVEGNVNRPKKVELNIPLDSATVFSSNIGFSWHFIENASNYNLQLSKNISFDTIFYENNYILDSSIIIPELEDSTTYYWRVRAVNIGGSGNWSNIRTFKSTIFLNESLLRVKILTEGLFSEITNSLRRADTLKASIINLNPPFNIIDSAFTIIDTNSFVALFKFQFVPSGTYYLKMNHHNSIETWSNSSGIIFNQSDTVLYDFTSSQSNAFGNNMVLKGTKYCIYSGDVNQGGNIDLTDVVAINNDATVFSSGYLVTDLNGDYITDLTDLLMGFNNSSMFIAKITP